MTEDRRAWAVIARMHAELKRQAIVGGIRNSVPNPDSMACVPVTGLIDLASLADVTKQALRENFGVPDHAE